MESPLWQTVLGALAALGGGGLIVLGFSGWLGRVWADRLNEQLKASNTQVLERVKAEFVREVESYKIKLKKSEFLFEKEFDAASAFTVLVRGFYPRSNRPGMDWHDAYTDLAHSFEKIEEQLHVFLASYGPVLQDEERTLFWRAFSYASDGKFQSADDPQCIQLAESLWKTLEDIEARLISRVRDQASL